MPSFRLAAAELGVGQAAVGPQAKGFEEDFTVPLCVRFHRRVDLGADAQLLAKAMSSAFKRVVETIKAIRRPLGDDMEIVGTTLAFPHVWLVLWLLAFHADHPRVKLRLISEDVDFDLRRGRAKLADRHGKPPFSDRLNRATIVDQAFLCAVPRSWRGSIRLRPWKPFPLIGLE